MECSDPHSNKEKMVLVYEDVALQLDAVVDLVAQLGLQSHVQGMEVHARAM